MNIQIKGFLVFCCLIISMTTFGQSSTSNNAPLKGTWSYSVADVPSGYEKGTIEFKQVEDKLTGILKNGSGTFNIREIKKENQAYTSTFYVDGSEVKMTLEQKADKITGLVKVEGWDIPITLTPVKE